jgi:hypothetical protein
MARGRFTIPTRVFLNAEQREKLFQLAREHEVELPELLTELLVSFLEHLPSEEQAAADTDAAPADDTRAEIQQRRAELRRLHARAVASGDSAPPWLSHYVQELERELGRLEERAGRAQDTP